MEAPQKRKKARLDRDSPSSISESKASPSNFDIKDVVNLERYPIVDLSTKEAKYLIARCKKEFEDTGSLSLRGFIREDVIKPMYHEIKGLVYHCHRRLEVVNPWGIARPDFVRKEEEKLGRPLEKNHALNHFCPQDTFALANDLIPADCLVNQVYKSEIVRNFVAAILEIKELHLYGDEFQRLNLMYIKDGGNRAWHFDNSDFVITLMLNPSQIGGEFEFAPHMRDSNMNEDFDSLKEVFNGRYPTNIRIPEAGSIHIFKGNRAMHRVRVVYGPEVRTLAVLSYDSVPDRSCPPAKNISLYGDRVRQIYRARGEDV
jgi:hypothetical protein